jgi:MFS family permease
MRGTITRLSALLTAVAILLIGHGLQLTLLPVHAEGLGWSASAIGTSGSAYFLGFVVGCVLIPPVVGRVGHIRTFMVMGALATVALLAAGLLVTLPAWLVFRFVTGFALSGLYMVIESWLVDVTPSNNRGTILALYTVICLLGMSVGQAFLGMASPMSLELFMAGAALICLAIIPVGLARVAAPHPIPSARFSPAVLLKASRVAIVCAFAGGLVTGAFWTLGPVLARAFGLDAVQVGAMMGAGIIGGAVVQIPVGRLSDRTDRRLVIGGLMAAGALVALCGWFLAGDDPIALSVIMFLFGAATFCIYAVCIAHASDNADIPLVEIASGILIMNSAGSIAGPIVVALLMDRFGPESFFAYVLVCLAPAAVWVFYRTAVVERSREHEHASILPRTTQAIAELSPSEPDVGTDTANG